MTIMENSNGDTDHCAKHVTEPSSPNSTTTAAIIELIANQKDAFFKSQQRGEQDLSLDEKRLIVRNLLESKKSLFIHRYGKFLDENFLSHVESLPSDDNKEEMDVQISQLRDRIKSNKRMVHNRRYNAAQKLLTEGTYFSDSEMQSRQPFLFEQMVGQYMDEKERKELQDSSYRLNYNNTNFSSYLMEQIRSVHLNCRYMVDEHIDNQEEEEEDDDDDEDKYDRESNDKDVTSNPTNITAESKEQLHKEFRDTMVENFLMGKDQDFDYSEVDNNEDYDMSAEFERDHEDRYFEED